MSNPVGINDEFTKVQMDGLVLVNTYCEENPTTCCGSTNCGGIPAGPGNTQPIIGWCNEFTVVRVKTRYLKDIVTQYCVSNPSDCCQAGSGSGSGSGSLTGGGTNNQGHEGFLPPGAVLIGLNAQKTRAILPPGSEILDTYCLFSPVTCCGGPPPPVQDCYFQQCQGTLATSQCNGVPMSSKYYLTIQNVANQSPQVCQFDCTDGNNETLTLNGENANQIGFCAWRAPLTGFACYTNHFVQVFYNGNNRTMEGLPTNSWILMIENHLGGAVAWWSIPDSEWHCNACNVFDTSRFIFALPPSLCNWQVAKLTFCPVSACGGSGSSASASGSVSASASASVSGSGSTVAQWYCLEPPPGSSAGSVVGSGSVGASASGSGSGSGSVTLIPSDCCPAGIPSVLKVTFSLGACCLDGLSIILVWDGAEWTGTINGCGGTVSFSLVCINPGIGNLFWQGTLTCSVGGPAVANTTTFTCTPFHARMDVPANCGDCFFIIADITEV